MHIMSVEYEEQKRKNYDQNHEHTMDVLRFLFILVPLNITIIVVVLKSEDARLPTVIAGLASWVTATIVERNRKRS